MTLRPLKVLLAEDSPEDAELIIRELRRAGFDPHWCRVDSEDEFRARLTENFELVLSDYRMPSFHGLRALEILTESGCEIPFILISGTIGEEIAVLAMKSGVTDYLLKDRLARLGTAVTQALQKYELRREKLKASETLMAERAFLRALIDLLPDAIYVKDLAGRFLLVNNACASRLRVAAPSELIGRKETDYLAPDEIAVFLEAEERVLRGEPLTNDEQSFTPTGGQKRVVLSTKVPLRDAAGKCIGLVGLVRDITESKQLHEQFLRAQRMEAIGTLAGGIAHDLNNILAPVVMASGLLLDNPGSDRDRELLKMIQDCGARGSNVVRQMLTFSRGIGGERVLVQIRHLLREMIEIMRETFPRAIAIKDESGADLCPITGDPTQLHQVIMNLCVNARDAMPDGGILSLGGTNIDLSAADVRAHPSAQPGPYVALKVKDTGHGIPPAIIDNIFDPFFTTKPPTEGTGLGLSTVVGIVRSHGGFITVTSVVGQGSEFTIYLPVAAETRAARDKPDMSIPPRGNGELILVVDDEPLVLTALRLTLEKNGYRVLAASSGTEALALFETRREQIRLVITDVMMPGMSGLKLIGALRAVKPGVSILATSGLIDQASYNDLLAVHVNGIIAKPSESGDILRAVHVELNRLPS